ncbi:MAG: type II toxin-antitoxin system RatA family toxin [Burkholderiales bacterium]
MAQVKKTMLVSHPAETMFKLVDAVEKYPEFLPWCGGTEIVERDDVVTHAVIKIDYHGIKQSFATRNRKQGLEWMQIEMVRGPFRHLVGHWRFKPLSPDACRIEFNLEYEFSNSLLEKLVGPVFHYIANTFVEAFLQRADELQAASGT